MPIETRCNHCNSTFRVPATAVGKRTKCPKCQQPFTVAAKLGGTSAAQATASSTSSSQQWHAKSPDGEQYGPSSKAEIDQWVAEGRIDGGWQLLREGDAQWQWASEVYPQLKQSPQEEAPPAISIDSGSATPSGASTPSFGSAATGQVDPNTSSGKYKPAFRARQYPAMRFVSYFFYGLAGLTAISLLLSFVGLALMGGGGAMGAVAGDEMGAAFGGMMILIAVFYGVMSLLWHGMFIAGFVYAAESVRIVMDIQQNTQETAYHTKYGTA